MASVADTLARVTAALPGGGEERPGQVRMAEAVEAAIVGRRHLVVQAGTGTGKSLAYLVPALAAEARVVVATATKALQDQLAGKDAPLVVEALGVPASVAVLKGRGNYACLQKVAELGGRAELPLEGGPGRLGAQVARLATWARRTEVGDRDELDFAPDPRAWAAVSTTARDCPGAFRCPSGHRCLAEAARQRAATADVVVVNTHLYGAHVASGGVVLPPHDVVVFDEAHEVEEVMTASLGVEIAPGRFGSLAASARGLVAERPAGAEVVAEIAATAEAAVAALGPRAGRRLGRDGGPGADGEVLERVLELARGRLGRLVDELRGAERDAGQEDAEGTARRDRVLLAAGHLLDDLDRVTSAGDDEVAWVDGTAASPVLRLSPIDVAPVLAERLFSQVTAVLTSATVPVGTVARLGLPPDETDELDVGSPFDYRDHAVLYVATSLPDRRRPEAEPAIHDELETLIRAAGGRTLALFTSWRAMTAAVEALRPRLDLPVLAQPDLPKAALVERFRAEEAASLFATLGFWQGVDVPGRTLSLVTIDRIPFPRPDDPVLEARRERAGPRAFAEIDLPRAGTLLAQGAGRLVRTADDRGVVAVLDRRLATASYRRVLLARVPPMRRTTDRAEVCAFLSSLSAAAGGGGRPG
jgi:ATP-dependent DNA helicase DinG